MIADNADVLQGANEDEFNVPKETNKKRTQYIKKRKKNRKKSDTEITTYALFICLFVVVLYACGLFVFALCLFVCWLVGCLF